MQKIAAIEIDQSARRKQAADWFAAQFANPSSREISPRTHKVQILKYFARIARRHPSATGYLTVQVRTDGPIGEISHLVKILLGPGFLLRVEKALDSLEAATIELPALELTDQNTPCRFITSCRILSLAETLFRLEVATPDAIEFEVPPKAMPPPRLTRPQVQPNAEPFHA